MIAFTNLLKHIAGFKRHRSASEIIEIFRGLYPGFDFHAENMLLLSDRNQVRIWLVWTDTHIWIAGDNGHKARPMLNREKDKFSFHIIYENYQPRLYINHTITTLPIDTAYTGSIKQLTARLNKILHNPQKEALELIAYPMD
ncbi:MAG: hypothetical protein IBJ09_10915 [Bacteroidia bacterium]|nr:hypothetical protein [Bacteroidia bacterium]